MNEIQNNAHTIVSNDEGINKNTDLHNNVMAYKTLSPFTWSHLNIKLPKINKKISNPVVMEQPTTNNHKQPKRKSHQDPKVKLESISKTIDINKSLKKQTKSEQIDTTLHRYRKESVDEVHRSTNLDKAELYQVHNPEKLRNYKRDLITRHLEKGQAREQSPKEKSPQLMNQTTKNISRLRSPILSVMSRVSANLSPQTFSYNKIQTYLFKGLLKCNWNQVASKDTNCVPELVWSDHYAQHTKFNSNQLHNHIKNIHLLTTKSSLHQMQSAIGSQHYPQSFIMPFQYQNFCEEYEQQIIKICLKQIVKNASHRIDFSIKSKINLGSVLSEMSKKGTPNDDTLMGLRLCLYLQQYRKSKNYKYFESAQNYVPIQTRLQPSVLSTLFKACYQYWQIIVKNQNSAHTHTISPYFKIANIDQDIIDILASYHCMLLKYEKEYHTLPSRNVWIVKPIASSRGAGISLLRNTQQFLTINHDRFELTNKAKYANKIIQKYIQQPLLLKQPQFYFHRKFDIRQWVLVTCDKQTCQPLIYIFEDAYCRFSDMKFTYNYYRSQQCKIHLTNYAVADKAKNPQHSVLLLSELFGMKKQLQQTYNHQINKIVVETVMNVKDIKFQQNKFELLGYDVMFDTNGKLWLLQINMNPACQASRTSKLQKMSDRMVADMMNIVQIASGKTILDKIQRGILGWKLVYGQQKSGLVDFDETEAGPSIKPFYDVSLGKASFVEEVKRRSIMGNAIQKIVTIYYLKQVWLSLVKCNRSSESKIDVHVKQEDAEEENSQHKPKQSVNEQSKQM